MNFVTKMLIDDATYWQVIEADGEGWYTFEPPQHIKVRWEDRRVVFKDTEGVEQVSSAVVYTGIDLELLGYLYKGKSFEADPKHVPLSFVLQNSNKVASLKGDIVLREVIL